MRNMLAQGRQLLRGVSKDTERAMLAAAATLGLIGVLIDEGVRSSVVLVLMLAPLYVLAECIRRRRRPAAIDRTIRDHAPEG